MRSPKEYGSGTVRKILRVNGLPSTLASMKRWEEEKVVPQPRFVPKNYGTRQFRKWNKNELQEYLEAVAKLYGKKTIIYDL